MSSSVKLSQDMIERARVSSRALNRSVAGQIEHWAKIGRIAEENPDLTYGLIKDLLFAQQELLVGDVEPYVLGDKK